MGGTCREAERAEIEALIEALTERYRVADRVIDVSTAALADTAEGAAARAAAAAAAGATFDQFDDLLADAAERVRAARAAIGRLAPVRACGAARHSLAAVAQLRHAVDARESQAAALCLQAVAKALLEGAERRVKIEAADAV